MKKLVILSTQRSGSTMVCDDIAGTEKLGKPSEYFINVIESLGKVSSSELRALIEEAMKKGEINNNITAVKIMSNQLKSIGKALQESNLCDKQSVEECFFEFFKDAIFIRVIRTDKVAQAVSRLMAKKTDVYHATTNNNIKGMEGMLGKVSKERDESKFKYDFDEIENERKLIIKEEQYLNNVIKRFGLVIDKIVYEEVINNRDYVLNIGKNMDIENITLKERRLKKVSGSISKEWIQKFKVQRAEMENKSKGN